MDGNGGEENPSAGTVLTMTEGSSKAAKDIPSGKHTKNYEKIHHAINGKTQLFHTISMVIFNSKLLVYQRVRISPRLGFTLW